MQGGELVALFTPGGSPKQNTLARLPFEFDFQGIRTRGKVMRNDSLAFIGSNENLWYIRPLGQSKVGLSRSWVHTLYTGHKVPPNNTVRKEFHKRLSR